MDIEKTYVKEQRYSKKNQEAEKVINMGENSKGV